MIADPVASVAMSRASSIINNFNKLLSVEKKGLDEIKNEINTALLNIDIKIIIVIDDLDRLADTDIQEIFQLVRSIADFKNTIYILSYDEEIVSKALDKIQKDKGGKYIEKIVQVPIKLPKVSQENLKDIFIKKLKTIHIKYEALDKDEFIKKIKEKDIRLDNYRASGAGGKQVKKTESAVRITHFPTGIVVQCKNETSQPKNKATAFKMLNSRLYVLELMKQQDSANAGEKSEIGWGHQIRSYVLFP
ncbi:peptide chain release factor-like protein, partial [Campylobacter coli]|uniref:peptide chain release factor-like protein n=1 Tax=Campylobacter coli TaxID=195 RepID=UPI003816A145